MRHSRLQKRFESSEVLRKLPAGSKVFVYRTESNKWEVPLTFINIEGEAATVQTRRGRRILRCACVNPFTGSEMKYEGKVGREHKPTTDTSPVISKGTYAALLKVLKKIAKSKIDLFRSK